MNIRYQTYTVPIADTCTICGIKFAPGESVTLSPPMHRACDVTGTLIDGMLARDMDAISRQLDNEFDA